MDDSTWTWVTLILIGAAFALSSGVEPGKKISWESWFWLSLSAGCNIMGVYLWLASLPPEVLRDILQNYQWVFMHGI